MEGEEGERWRVMEGGEGGRDEWGGGRREGWVLVKGEGMVLLGRRRPWVGGRCQPCALAARW